MNRAFDRRLAVLEDRRREAEKLGVEVKRLLDQVIEEHHDSPLALDRLLGRIRRRLNARRLPSAEQAAVSERLDQEETDDDGDEDYKPGRVLEGDGEDA